MHYYLVPVRLAFFDGIQTDYTISRKHS